MGYDFSYDDIYGTDGQELSEYNQIVLWIAMMIMRIIGRISHGHQLAQLNMLVCIRIQVGFK